MKQSGAELIAAERQEQIKKHGYTLEADSWSNSRHELRNAALFALTLDKEYYPKNWDDSFKKKLLSKRENDIEILKIAGALIAAEIDRLNAIK